MCLCTCGERIEYGVKYFKWKNIAWVRKAKYGKQRRLHIYVWSIFRDQVNTYGISCTFRNILSFHIFGMLGASFHVYFFWKIIEKCAYNCINYPYLKCCFFLLPLPCLTNFYGFFHLYCWFLCSESTSTLKLKHFYRD